MSDLGAGLIPRRGPSALAVAVLCVLGFAGAAVLVTEGYPSHVAALLVIAIAAPVAVRYTSPENLIAVVILTVLLVPANIYKLPSVLPFDMEVYRLAVLALIAVWLVAAVTDTHIRLRSTPLDIPMLLLALGVSLSFIRNVAEFGRLEYAQSLKAVMNVLVLIVLYYVVVSTVRDDATLLRLVRLIVLAGAFVSFFAIVERLTGFSVFRTIHLFVPVLEPSGAEFSQQLTRGGIRAAGSAGHPIAFGTMLALVFPFAAQLWFEEKSAAERALAGWSSALLVVGMMVTVSRTAVVGLLASLALLAIFRPRSRAVLATGFVLVSFAVHMFFPGVIRTFIDLFTPSSVLKMEVGNAHGRLSDYPLVWAEFMKKPLFGRGIGTFTWDRFFFVDNQYLTSLVELGVFGLGAMVVLLVSALVWLVRRATRMGGRTGAVVLSAAASTLVFALSTATFETLGFAQVSYLYFILLAIGVAAALNHPDDAVRVGAGDARV